MKRLLYGGAGVGGAGALVLGSGSYLLTSVSLIVALMMSTLIIAGAFLLIAARLSPPQRLFIERVLVKLIDAMTETIRRLGRPHK